MPGKQPSTLTMCKRQPEGYDAECWYRVVVSQEANLINALRLYFFSKVEIIANQVLKCAS